jgi:hypothetical protein
MKFWSDEPERAVTDDPEFQELLFLATAGFTLEQARLWWELEHGKERLVN